MDIVRSLVRNYYNTEWELISTVSTENTNRLSIYLNKILIMGVVSLYQVMSHTRSVLLTQICAYRCQNGRMQVVYLAQIIYHLVYNSDLYWLGLATGTLTLGIHRESFVLLLRLLVLLCQPAQGALRDQQLDRNFRLTWEAMQLVLTAAVVALLKSVQHTPLVSIIEENAQILRKSSTSDTKYCGLNDSCILFTVNMITIAIMASVGVGVANKMSPRARDAAYLARKVSSARVILSVPRGSNAGKVLSQEFGTFEGQQLTSFEQNCLDSLFTKLFHDCDDIAYVTYNDQRCVEALLLAGYLYYGKHVYQASSVMLLVVARVVPPKILRTFNVLLLRCTKYPEWILSFPDCKQPLVLHPAERTLDLSLRFSLTRLTTPTSLDWWGINH